MASKAANTRRTTGKGVVQRQWMWWWWWCVCWLWWCSCVDVGVGAQKTGDSCLCDYDGDDVAVAAVVSVLVTLIVVAAVVVIGFLVIRKRKPDLLYPSKREGTSLVNSEDKGIRFSLPRESCFENPAFSGSDTVDLENDGGRPPAHRKISLPVDGKEPGTIRKPSLLSCHDVPDGRHERKGSLEKSQGGETVSVWLQSQDIIGLGFNICGNVRDGIFVSQVHNRGPAIESGKMHVGDRILSVTIRYDKIVFEDALTILSYASPYPVHVSLQKQPSLAESTRSGRRSSEVKHPLFRSQSLEGAASQIDDLPHFRNPPKRWQSDSQHGPNSVGGGDGGGGGGEKEKMKRRVVGSKTLPPMGWDFPVDDILAQSRPESEVVMVHAPLEKSAAANDPACYHLASETLAKAKKKGDFKETPVPKSSESPQFTKKGRQDNREMAFDFASLSDQLLDSKGEDDDTDIFVAKATGLANSSPKTPPNKPERKKKTSSGSITSITSDDSPLKLDDVCSAVKAVTFQALPPGIQDPQPAVEELYTAVKTTTVHSLPPGSHDSGSEVEEEEIQATHIKREVVINTEGFDFHPVDRADRQAREAAERPKSPLSFMYTKRPARSVSPEGEPVEEDVIEAIVASRDAMSAPLPRSASDRNDKGRGPNRTVAQAKDMPILDEDDLERLLIKAPRGLGGSNLGQDLGAGQSETPLQNDSEHHLSQGKAPGLSEDFITIDMSGRSGPGGGGGLVFGTSHSDNHLEQRSVGSARSSTSPEDVSLEWSGQRLVRSDSFTEIPQDDSDGDWVDRQARNGDGDGDGDDGEGDGDGKRLTVVTGFGRGLDVRKAHDFSSNLSDLTDSMSSSSSSSPVQTNGPVTLAPGTRGVAVGKTASLELSPSSDKNANSMHFSLDSTADC